MHPRMHTDAYTRPGMHTPGPRARGRIPGGMEYEIHATRDGAYGPVDYTTPLPGGLTFAGMLAATRAVPTVKVDGASTTLSMDERGQVHVYSRNWELDSMSSNMRLAKRFQLDKMLWPGMAVQFELCGPGIQSNRLKLPAQRPFVFAVWKDRHKIDRDQWPTGMPNLAVPELDENEWALTGSVDDMIAKVDGLRGNVTKDRLDEGIVWHLHEDQQLSEGLANELGANRCFKIINNKYLTKNGL